MLALDPASTKRRTNMRSSIHRALSLILLCGLTAACASDNPSREGGFAPITHEPYGTEMQEFRTYPPEQIEWRPGPASLPPGAQMAVLEGDPSRQGPFVFRAKLPDGYTIPPHMHPKAERLTVIQGTFYIAEGRRLDKSTGRARVMPAGSYGYWPARMPHYAWASGETIIQLHGHGPWMIEYLNPEDDPRHARQQ
jgi:hypothetical protein